MLDTYILDIPKGYYRILRHDMFSPTTEKMHLDKTFYRKYVNNPTATDKQSGTYKPKLTIYRRGALATLRIEASAAKIIHNNNLAEITEADFDSQIALLKEKILSMGVNVADNVLRRAPVVGFHPSKNILISGGYSAMGVISELAKVNLTEKMDLSKTNFRNSGHGLQYYAKAHSLTFYDKMYDLTKTENRAFDADQKMQQLSLFDFLQKKNKPEILRMEVRLSEKVKMNDLLGKLGHKQNPNFSDIFKTAVCKDVLNYYFNSYLLPSLFVFDLDNNPQSILKRILRKNPKIRATKAVGLVGLQLLCKDNGVRNLRKIVEPKTSLRSWQRVAEQIKLLNKLASVNTSHTFLKDIQQSLEKFEPYKIKNDSQIPSPEVKTKLIAEIPFDPMQYH